MNIDNIKYSIEVNEQLIRSVVSLEEKCTSSMVNGALNINFSLSNNLLNIKIKNNSSTPVSLNNLRLELFSARHYKEAFCIINPQSTSEKVTYIPMSKVNENEKVQSHLFEIFVDEETNSSKIFGFLGCKVSTNLIENVVTKNELEIAAVCNFLNQELNPGEELDLDSIYISEGKNTFSLFNSFVDKMLVNFNLKEAYNKKLVLKKSNAYSILFTYKANSSTLKINDKPVYLKVDGKKLYAVDISKPEGRKKVFVNANAVLSRANALNLDSVGQYISVVQNNKLFNVNYELSKLLTSIKSQFEGIRVFSDDYPLGLLDENIIVDNIELAFEDKKSLLSHLSKRKNNHHINYNFFIRLLMQRLITYHNVSFATNSKKLSELMSAVLDGSNINSLKSGELIEITEDIDTSYGIIPFVEKNKAFALLITGKKHMYLAVFNLGSEAVKFYCDLNVYSGHRELEGVATEVYSNTNYLISDGKLYVRNLPPLDCCLFKKKIDCQVADIAGL
jgi:hypothetical protein